MENYNIKNRNHSNSVWSGLIILVIGVVFFLRSFGIYIPGWIFSWNVLLIVIGLFIGFKRNFNGGGWLVMVLIGGYFTMQDISDLDFSKYYFALAFIALGLYLILKPKRSPERWRKKFDKSRFSAKMKEQYAHSGDYTYPGSETVVPEGRENDFVDSVNVFGGAHRPGFPGGRWSGLHCRASRDPSWVHAW